MTSLRERGKKKKNNNNNNDNNYNNNHNDNNNNNNNRSLLPELVTRFEITGTLKVFKNPMTTTLLGDKL